MLDPVIQWGAEPLCTHPMDTGGPQVKRTSPGWLTRVAKLDPALLRGAVVSVLALVTAVVGNEVVTNEQVESGLDLVVALSAIVAAFLIKPAVTPNAKVIVFKPEPFEEPSEFESGPAVLDLRDEAAEQELVLAARVAA